MNYLLFLREHIDVDSLHYRILVAESSDEPIYERTDIFVEIIRLNFAVFFCRKS